MNNYLVRLYMVEDGIPNFTDSFIRAVWNKVEEDGSDYWLNYNGTVFSAEKFVSIVKDPDVLFSFVFKGRELVAFTWTTKQRGKTAEVHFCMFSEVWGRETVSVGRYILEFYSKIFDSLTGMFPTDNALLCRYASLVGMDKIGVLPNGGWNAHENKSCDMLVTHIDFKGGRNG